MIRKFHLDAVRQFLLRQFLLVVGKDDVFVYPGKAESMFWLVGIGSEFTIPEKPKLYGLCVRELPDWDITLVGRVEQVNDIAGNEDSLFQAYLVAYPVNCPECGRSELIPVTIDCGGDKNRRWSGACTACGKLNLMLGKAFMVPSTTEPGVFQIVEPDTSPQRRGGTAQSVTHCSEVAHVNG